MKQPRTQDIAKAAGVSPATVTRVLRGSGYVSNEKRELVCQAARQLGYDFTRHAENNGIPQILIFSPYSDAGSFNNEKNRLFSDILEALCFEIQKMGWYSLVYYLTDNRNDEIARVLKDTCSLNIKGAVFISIEPTDNVSDFRKLIKSFPIPVVMIERFSDIFGINKIMINAKEAVFIAVHHLYKQGHRKIAFLSTDQEYEVERSRVEGFKSAISAFGLEQKAHFVPIEGYSAKHGESALKNYIEQWGMPTGIICADTVMVGVSNYLYENHIRIPEEVSLISLDDTLAGIMTPPITGVAFPVKEIARNAVGLLTEETAAGGLAKTISLSTYLVERESVAEPEK